MSDFELLFEDAAFVFNFIFSLILLIVFLRLAWNVGKLRRFITRPSADSMMDIAEKFDFKGQNDKAIDAYLDALYYVIDKSDDDVDEKKKNVRYIQKKITALGGSFPDSTEKALRQNLGDF